MAAHPGEDVAATLFADVHYYYDPETETPRHHRFDRGSYVYLHEDAQQRRARIEIANNAGTEDQDAFDGLLDKVEVIYDYKHPNLVTLIIDAFNSPASHPPQQTEEWRLPHYDLRNETKYLYKLHSFDIYLWTKEDANLFMNTVRRLLPEHHIQLIGEPPAPAAHAAAMSPLVQNLENVVISQTSQQPQIQDYAHSQHSSSSKPGSVVQPQTSPGPIGSAPAPQTQAPAPMAYNPAAPPAPEAIAHREKTPPPQDGGTNHLAMAAHDQQVGGAPTYGGSPFQPQLLGRTQTMPVQSPGYFPGPPMGGSGQYAPGTAATQAISPQAQQTGTPFGQPGVPSGFSPQSQHGHQQPLQSNPYAVPASPGFAAPPQQQYGSQQGYAMAVAPTAPMGGFSQYHYGQQGAQGQGADYAVHQQVYRPTEGEAAIKVNKLQEGGAGQGGVAGKLGSNAVRLEKGLTGMLRKFEKKYA